MQVKYYFCLILIYLLFVFCIYCTFYMSFYRFFAYIYHFHTAILPCHFNFLSSFLLFLLVIFMIFMYHFSIVPIYVTSIIAFHI